MKGFAMLKIGEVGWIEKDRPQCGPLDAICKPLAVALCTSDVHTVWEGAVGERHNMILGHECCAQVVEVGSEVRDFKPGDRVLIPAITPNWSSLEAQAGYAMHSDGNSPTSKTASFRSISTSMTLTAIWHCCRRAWTLWMPVCFRTWFLPVFMAWNWRTCNLATPCWWWASALLA